MKRPVRVHAFPGRAAGAALLLVLARGAFTGAEEAPSGPSLRSNTEEHLFPPRHEDHRVLSTNGMGGPAASRDLGVIGQEEDSTPVLTSYSRLSANNQEDVHNSKAETKSETTNAKISDNVLSLSTSNEYKPVTTTPWSNLLAEPFRETTLTVTSNAVEGNIATDLFFITIWDGDGSCGMVLRGREVKFTFENLGKQRVTVTQVVASTGKTHHLDTHVMVKYVRREIRQLTVKDREAFFNALETVYRLSTAEGNLIYGDEYKGIEFFVQMHLDGAGVKDCDHWHDDAGIMTHHVGYTLLFEQTLQLINSAVTIPYWEYTIEDSQGYSSYGESEVFSPDWFGDASPTNALHTVDRGRFAFLRVMQDATEFIHNAYGLLRTPWNLDSTPYVTRHNMTNNMANTEMVTCQGYKLCFDSHDLATLNNCLNGGTHGPVHIIMGGEWNNPEETFIQMSNYPQLVPLLTKYLWRKGYLRLPEACSPKKFGFEEESCRASCPRELYESRGMTPYDVLLDVQALYWVSIFTNGIIVYNPEKDRFVITGHEDDTEFQEAFWIKMLHSFCDPGDVGELFTSSAPYDPLFWVIHPTAERFLSWRRTLGRDYPEKYPLLEKWGYAHEHIVGETGMICDWSMVREDTLDMPTCIKGICGGHKAKDLLPFKIKLKGEVLTMTNEEWLEFIYPTNEDLPYVYNEYRWDHCGDPLGTVPHK